MSCGTARVVLNNDVTNVQKTMYFTTFVDGT